MEYMLELAAVHLQNQSKRGQATSFTSSLIQVFHIS